MRSPSGPRSKWYEVAAAVVFASLALMMAKLGIVY